MSSQKFQLAIASPCSESLEKMSPHPQGFYCHTCAHKVIDFTEQLPAEIASFFAQHPAESICGRFYAHQLEADYVFRDTHRKTPSLKYAAGFLVSMLLAEQTAAENLVLKPVTEQRNTHNSNFTEKQLPPKTLIIKGQVMDVRTHQGVPHAKISVAAPQQGYYSGTADANGFFEFGIAESYDPKAVITVANERGALLVVNLGQFRENPSHQLMVNLTPIIDQPVKMGKPHRVDRPTIMGKMIDKKQ